MGGSNQKNASSANRAKPCTGAPATAECATGAGTKTGQPFWKKPLEQLSKSEWEALCDGCGRCCLAKLEDEDTGKVHFTNITCRLFDSHTCRCGDYQNRQEKVPDCVSLTTKNIKEIAWLPPTCAYRLRAEKKDLFWWHPLVSGSEKTVHQAGISVRGRAGPSEDELSLKDYPNYIVKWPGNAPSGRTEKK